MSLPAIDPKFQPQLRFRIDSFSVPEAARAEFQETLYRNTAFLQTLPGFLGHTVFEKTDGPTQFNVATIAVWESQEAVDRAVERVRAYYREIGLDMSAMIARWGAKAELGFFRAASRQE